jgi:hypothetical protein
MPTPAANEDPATDDEYARAQGFVCTLLETYEAYHNHKESMAYAGFTAYAALFGAALLTPTWPQWGEVARIGAASVTWLFFLAYLGWQLRLRRLASIRVAGLERLLADWITHPPTTADLRPVPLAATAQRSRYVLLGVLSTMWPLRQVLPHSDLPDTVYPKALVTAWTEQVTERGTDAMFHERLLFAAGWLLYVLVLGRATGIWALPA